MGSFGSNSKHHGNTYQGLKVKMVTRNGAENLFPPARPQHWEVCYSLWDKVAVHHSFVTTPLYLIPTQLHQPAIIFTLVLQALDIFEDDMSMPTDTKIPLLEAFHRHIYNPDLKISSGTTDLKDVVDQFHHVQTAFLDLERSYQEVIEETVKGTGAGMAKFINQKIETVDDYNEYSHHVAVLPISGLTKLVHVSGLGDLAPDKLLYSLGLLLQKADTIIDYLKDINDTPKPRKLWPRQIWSKYVNKLEDLKCEENSVKALQCLNEMVTDALMHTEDCLEYMSTVRDPYTFQIFAMYEVNSIRALTLCYNNIEVFRSGVELKIGVTLRIFNQTKTMPDLYRGFFKYSSLMKSKVEKDDPNAAETLSRLEAIQKICKDSGIVQ